ncbi:hypothetical protein IMSAGC013_01760 [Lachnospiraceae bacterium]|nr:Gfo/Idh/MocA family oxidoreductase [Lachnospiraceae bacterium]GFI30370.1 hypothetical protein IMSAGC013_01760 [Lachnospiraceae bacterium]
MNRKTAAIIGAGYMAKEYYKVLRAMGHSVLVLGRGEEKARAFEEEFGQKVFTGDYRAVLQEQETMPEYAVIAVNVGGLCTVTQELIRLGIPNILVEKPVAYRSWELAPLIQEQEQAGANVYVAYNRRFFASVQEAERRIREDGGVTSFHFEFTEWAHTIGPAKRPEGEKEGWIFANSTHVMDLAFFLGGFPKEMKSYAAGGLDWHPSGSNYAGAGISEKGALFSYQANWEAPGRWAVEVLTAKRRYYLKPVETLQIQELGSVNPKPAELAAPWEESYKPGLYEMADAFLNHPQDKRLLTLKEHAEHFPVYEQIAGRRG